MAKIATNTKYVIEASIEIKGIVEEKDLAGAIFGQTEGLVETNLRELQNQGKVGRIELELKKQEKGTSQGIIKIPTNLSQEETAIIAAAIETIDKIGPCEAKVNIDSITDVRIEKQQKIKSRALELLSKMRSNSLNTQEAVQDIKDEIKIQKAINILGTTAGPDVEKSKDIIIVEGRADVLALLRAGVNNAIAIGGARIKQKVVDFAKGKTVTLFVDGDKGGEIIKKTLSQKLKISYLARAPDGKEVEELTPKEILLALRKKQKYQPNLHFNSESKTTPRHIIGTVKSNTNFILKKYIQELAGTQLIYLLDYRNNILARISQTDLNDAVNTFGRKINVVLVDGKITSKIVKNVKDLNKTIILVGTEKARNLKPPENILIFTKDEL